MKKSIEKDKKLISKKSNKRIRLQNRKITKAKRLYWFAIASGIFMFLYSIIALVLKITFLPVLAPLAIVFLYFISIFLKKNWKLIWLYIRDMEQGKLMLFLNTESTFSDEHKMKVVQWVYLRKKCIRTETKLKLTNKVMNGEKLNPEERILVRYKTVSCPQQLLDGFNKAVLVNALIYAHVNICLLDQELRDIMDLTDQNMASFRMQDEIDKCKAKK